MGSLNPVGSFRLAESWSIVYFQKLFLEQRGLESRLQLLVWSEAHAGGPGCLLRGDPASSLKLMAEIADAQQSKRKAICR